MTFRFSLKWLLAVMAYVAFVLAAVLQQGEVWASMLWLVHGFLLLVLVLVVAFYRGQSQAVAGGFLLFFVASVAAQKWAPERSPSHMVKVAIGVGGSEFDEKRVDIQQRLSNLAWEFAMSTNNADPEYRARVERESLQAAEIDKQLKRKVAVASCVDALGGVTSGLVGVLMASLLWRRAQRQLPAPGRTKGE